MRKVIRTKVYDAAIKKRPYLAMLTLTERGELDPQWVKWEGKPGLPGCFIADLNAGDVYMTGQSLQQVPSNGKQPKPRYWQITRDGRTAVELSGRQDAQDAIRRANEWRRHMEQWTSAGDMLRSVTDEELMNEVRRRKLEALV